MPSNTTVITRRIKQLEEENQTLKRNLIGMQRIVFLSHQRLMWHLKYPVCFVSDAKENNLVHYPNDLSSNEDTKRLSPTTETANGTRRLQDEINTLTKRNCGKNNLYLQSEPTLWPTIRKDVNFLILLF